MDHQSPPTYEHQQTHHARKRSHGAIAHPFAITGHPRRSPAPPIACSRINMLHSEGEREVRAGLEGKRKTERIYTPARVQQGRGGRHGAAVQKKEIKELHHRPSRPSRVLRGLKSTCHFSPSGDFSTTPYPFKSRHRISARNRVSRKPSIPSRTT